MYRLSFELVQHTPIIHFQADCQGATLRASEVKPKLDKYLLKYHAQHIAECDKSIHGEGDTQEKRVSLNYKLSFEAEDVITWPANRKNAPMYFGNIGDGKLKNLVFARGGVTMTILVGRQNRECQEKPKLADWLNSDNGHEAICNFFMLHNFGSRQSKGYGSFTIKETADRVFERAERRYRRLGFEIYIDPYIERIDFFSRSLDKEEMSTFYSSMLNAINYFYKSLRSGLNEQRKRKIGDDFDQVFYMKPMIYHYAKKLGLQWDKRSIKQAIVPQQQKEHDEDHKVEEPTPSPNEPKFDFRDMFGFSTIEKWKSKEYMDISGKKALMIYKTYSRGRATIPRMKSPIQLKPILLEGESGQYEFWVFIQISAADVGLNDILSSRVTTKVTGRGGVLERDKESITLRFKSDFNFSGFLNEAFRTGGFGFVEDEAQEMSTSYNEEGDQIEALLLDIYQQLQKLYKDE